MFNNKTKCFLSDLFSNAFQAQVNPSGKEMHNPSAKESLINQSLFKTKSFLLNNEAESNYVEDLFLHKVNKI